MKKHEAIAEAYRAPGTLAYRTGWAPGIGFTVDDKCVLRGRQGDIADLSTFGDEGWETKVPYTPIKGSFEVWSSLKQVTGKSIVGASECWDPNRTEKCPNKFRITVEEIT